MRLKRIVILTLAGIIALFSILPPLSNVVASVTLSSFNASPRTDHIILTWVTGSELNTLGFNVWRGTECDEAVSVKLNANLIPAAGVGALGSEYEFMDYEVEAGVLYDYRLEDVENSASGTCHHEFPVQAELTGDNVIVSPPPSSNTVTAPTSTTAPTNTPAPSATPAPSNTPRATSVQPSTAIPTATEQSAATALPPAIETAMPVPTSTQEPVTVEIDADSGDEPEGGTESVSEDPDQPGLLGAPPSDGDSSDALATADALSTAEAASAAEADAVAEVGAGGTSENDNQVQEIGEGEPDLLGDSAQTEQTESDSSDTLPIVLALAGGLFFVLAGIAAVWFLVINRQAA